MNSEARIIRLVKIMNYVAAHTKDVWARDYLIQRLQDHGFSTPQFVLDSDATETIRLHPGGGYQPKGEPIDLSKFDMPTTDDVIDPPDSN